MPATQGHCWLCNQFGKLSKEHIPPEKAFNDCPLLLMKVDERRTKAGVLEWALDRRQRGVYFRNLCEVCNSKYGSLYGGAYVDLVKRIAERIGDVQDFHRISILGVERPLAILKQVMLQFVTANGPGFVRANDWVAPFIRSRTNTTIPKDIGIYLFASNRQGMRKTGVSAHMDLNMSSDAKIVAEFTFWPLGTVVSFGELNDKRLAPIHQWVRFPFGYRGTADLHLYVNPVATDYPLDFRTESQVQSDAVKQNVEIKRPSEGASREMMRKAISHSGNDSDDWVFSGHPNTVKKMTQ